MEWDGHSEASSNARSEWNWSSWKETKDSRGMKTHFRRMEDHKEAPPLLFEPVLA